MVSTTFRRASEQTRAPFFSSSRSHSHPLHFPGFLSQISAGLRLSRPFFMRSFYDVLSLVFASDLSITQKTRVSSDPLHKDRHTYPQTFCHRAELRSAWERALLSARFCKHHCRTSVDSEFSTRSCRFFSESSSRLNLGSQSGAFFLFQQISLPVI